MSNQNDFNKGVEFVVGLIRQKFLQTSQPLIQKDLLEQFLNTIPKKCDFCVKPCGNSWCSTVKEKE